MVDDLLGALQRIEAGRFSVELPDGWKQGRGVFGGLVLGLLTQAAEAVAGTPERTLRSLTGTLCGPACAGNGAILVEELRTGTGVSTVAARLVQNGDVQAHAVLVFGRPRDRTFDDVHLTVPVMPEWRDIPCLGLRTTSTAEFTQFFEYRNVGPEPFAGGGEAVATGWLRPRVPCSSWSPAWLVTCVDALWPTLLALAPQPRPVATVAFTFEPVGSLEGLAPDAPLFYRARLLAARNGYAVELRELWSADARLLALNHQTQVVI